MGRNISRREFIRIAASAAGAAFFSEVNPKLVFAESEPGGGMSDPELMEIFRDDQEKGVIRPRNLTVISLPMTRDFRYDPAGVIKVLSLDGNLDLGYKGTVTLARPDGSALVAAPLSHVTGEMTLPVAILETGRINSRGVFFKCQRHYRGRRGDHEGILGDYVYLAGPYPNKIYNLIRSVEQILVHQLENGGFKAGEEVSFRKQVTLEKLGLYRWGKTLSGEEVGGGACAGSSIFAKTMILSGKVKIKEIWGHRPAYWTYWAGPVDPTITAANSDASVDATHDLRLEFSEGPFYLRAGVNVLTPADYQKVSRADLTPGGDHLVFSLALTDKKPDFAGQLTAVRRVLADYGRYRDSGLDQTGETMKVGAISIATMGETAVAEWRAIGEQTYLTQRVDAFESEIRERADLAEIFWLANLVNQYPQQYPFAARSGPGVGSYLRSDKWFNWKVGQVTDKQRVDLEKALTFLDEHTYAYRFPQAVQCVGWVVLLARLGYPSGPRYIGGVPFRGPAELIPAGIKNLREGRTGSYANSQGMVIYGGDVPLSEVREGDLFLSYYTQVGHAGAVIAKKVIGGQTALLITEANRGADGLVIIRQVMNQTELAAMMGPWPNKIALLRNR